ncbi:hypothetical protein STCU_03159 [Strigomonas culicis]|nr:hypothetical protein STCU_03159 [Strigomonas culicis]|eukprot:EPY31865.1 hypothetical protein STCU_03159 [Strigomonas culicis]
MRSRLVIDPVWKPIDAQTYKETMSAFAAEASALGFIGLDLEWTTKQVFLDDDEKPRVHVGKVATVQLSTRSTTMVIRLCDVCALLDGTCHDPLAPLSRHWPCHRVGERENSKSLLATVQSDLHKMLADASVIKVGVGIMGDKKKLEADYEDISLASCVDLNVLAQHVDEREGGESRRHPFSLKDLLHLCCHRHLAKDVFVVRSDWGGGLGALSPAQIRYAAEDAEASFDISLALLERCGCHFSEAACDSSHAQRILAPLIAVAAKPTRGASGKKAKDTDGDDCAAARSGTLLCGRSKPYYDNINVYDVNMRLVFTVDLSKAKWYVYKKKLAKVVEWRPDPSSTDGGAVQIAAIQLSFAPDFSKYNDAHIRKNMDYFKQPKENVCVVCGGGGGSQHTLVRFAMVPFMYRKHFPSVYMSHNSYDLVLVCTTCFPKARGVYERATRRIADVFQVPIAPLTPRDLAAFRQEIARRREALPSDLRRYEAEAEGGAALAVHPELLLQVMDEYAEMCACREEILTIFKYAKALAAHFSAVEQQTLPPQRLEEMSAFVALHAPKYPFYDSACSSQEEQAAVLAADPTGPEVAHFILQGCRGAGSFNRTFREVLAEYWFRSHSYLLEVMAPTTRAEEKQDTAATTAAAPATLHPSLVDSHGFFVVRALLAAHASDHPADPLSAERAIGRFILQWRSVFCDSLAPQHMPQGWRKEDGVLL